MTVLERFWWKHNQKPLGVKWLEIGDVHLDRCKVALSAWCLHYYLLLVGKNMWTKHVSAGVHFVSLVHYKLIDQIPMNSIINIATKNDPNCIT